MIGYRVLDPLREKRQVYWRLREMLYRWGIPHEGRTSYLVHHVAEVGRLHLYGYWRPMTRSRFEELTLDYWGPHVPIFGSDREFADEEEWVGQGQKISRFTYHRVHPYFYLPAFALQEQWPHEREWRWTPVVRVTPKILRKILLKEVVYGGWTQAVRGRPRIPYRTGSTALSRTVEAGAGWASYSPDGARRVSAGGERGGDRDVHADLSVPGRARGAEDDCGQGQLAFPGDPA